METHQEREQRLLGGLTHFLVVDHAESTLFRPGNELLAETGVWAQYFDALMNRKVSRGRAFGLKWQMQSTCVTPQKGAIRFARWAEIEMVNEKLVVAHLPHYYTCMESRYLDARFVVAASSNKVLMAGLIFQDYVLGRMEVEDDPPWLDTLIG